MAASKDYTRQKGRRIRVALTVYDPTNRGYRGVEGQAARLIVANANEQRRLWESIDKLIEEGSWRDVGSDRPGRGAAHSAEHQQTTR
jgi:hypothetical protein